MKHAQDGMVGTGFAAFDEATNGLHPSEAYLVYGAAGLGKSTFALSFISEGLVAGEAVALVTARSPASVMEQARHSGLDFEAAFRDNRLFLFEYPEDIAGNSSRLLDDLRTGGLSALRTFVVAGIVVGAVAPGARKIENRKVNLCAHADSAGGARHGIGEEVQSSSTDVKYVAGMRSSHLSNAFTGRSNRIEWRMTTYPTGWICPRGS